MHITTLSQLEAALRAAGCKCDHAVSASTIFYRRSAGAAQCNECRTLVRNINFALGDGVEPVSITASKAPLDYKSHFLIGLRTDGAGLLIQRWNYTPSRKEVDDQIDKVKREGFLQFAVVNTTGFWDAIEKKEPPLWTARP